MFCVSKCYFSRSDLVEMRISWMVSWLRVFWWPVCVDYFGRTDLTGYITLQYSITIYVNHHI
jgi:hypothetical protein